MPGIPTSLVAGFLGPVFTAMVEALPSPIGEPDGLVFNGATAVGSVIVSLGRARPVLLARVRRVLRGNRSRGRPVISRLPTRERAQVSAIADTLCHSRFGYAPS